MEAPEGYEFVTQHQVLVKDTGHVDTLYGGIMLQWLDEAGAMYAEQVTRAEKLVTRALDAMEFLHPAAILETVRFYAQVRKRGRTSTQVHLKAFAHNPRLSNDPPRLVTEVSMTFVAVDEHGTKVPIPWE